MKNRPEPTSPELEEKKKVLEQKTRAVEKLKAEKASKDKEIENLENQLKDHKEEVGSALRYLDQLAKEHQDKLAELKKSPDPQVKGEIELIESKLALYRTVRTAASRFEESMGKGNLASFATTALSLRVAEGDAVIANAKMVLQELAPALEILRYAVGQPARLAPEKAKLAVPLKARVQGSQALHQQLNAALHYMQDALNTISLEEANLLQLKKLGGKEALQFAANTMKISALAGKINNLRNLHQTFGKDPLLKSLFPEPVEIPIPKMPPGLKPQKAASKPLTGILKEILGLGGKSS